MPIWNMCLAAAGTVVIWRRVYKLKKITQSLMSTPEVSPRFYNMMKKLARKMNIENSESIMMVTVNKLNCGTYGMRILPKDKVVVTFPKVVSDQNCARSQWKAFQQKCGHELSIDLLGKDAADLKIVFGINVPKNVIQFNIAHELAHVKCNDQFYSEVLGGSWFLITTLPMTNLVLAKVSTLKSSGYLNFELLPSFLDPVFFTKGLAVGSLWFVSYYLWSICHRRLNFKQEFRADRLAGEISVDIANGGISMLKAEKKFGQQCLLLKENERLRVEYDDNGDHVKSPTHPKTSERIKALERIVEVHNMKQQQEH